MEFSFHLAEQLHMTVGEMHARMSNREYVEWQVLYARRAQKAELDAKTAQHKKG